MNKNIGVIATKVFIFTAITISIIAILNGANIISNNIAPIIQVLSIVPILILVVNSNNRFSITWRSVVYLDENIPSSYQKILRFELYMNNEKSVAYTS